MEHELNMNEPQTLLEPIARLKKDLRAAAKTLTTSEVRYLVDLYYQIQDFRKAAGNQIAAMGRVGEPVAVLGWSFETMETIEKEIAKWLDIYTDNEPTGMGGWSKAICGIGPIISAGLLAHIDMRPWRCFNKEAKKKCTSDAPCGLECKYETIFTVGHIWRFAGLDPTMSWNKGEKRPWNAQLKVLCWKIGESFVKVSGNPKDVYGKIYLGRKAYEHTRNEAGQYKEQAT